MPARRGSPLLAPWLCASAWAVAAPQEPRDAAPREAAPVAELEAALERLAEQFHVPGMSAALVRGRKVAWSHGYGYADLEQGVWATPDTRYRIASVSKPFAAVLVLQLVEQGKLSLDAPMKDFLVHKWYAPDPARYREQPILVRHVLTHTSEGVPGDAYAYSGNIYGDLTWVLEDVTKTAYSRLLQQRIFDVAGMERTVPGHTRPGSTELVEMARPYVPDGEEYVPGTYPMMDPDPALDVSGFKPVFSMDETALAARRSLL